MQVLAPRFSAPRHITAQEGPGLLRMLNRIFATGAPFGMEREYPHLYGDMRANLEWTHVICHRGAIAAHVGIYPLDVVSSAGRLRVGGIGAVATLPEHRGQGLMAALLEHCTGWMRAHGMPVSILWGDHLRYARFGWTGAGARLKFTVTRRSAAALARWNLPVALVRNADRIAPELHALHRTLPVRVERSAAVFPLILRKVGRRVLVARAGRRVAAYALARRWHSRRHVSWSVEEAAGSPEGLLSLFRWLATRPGVDQVGAEASLSPQPHLARLLEAADGWSTSVIQLGQVKVVDLDGAARSYGQAALAPAIRRARLAPLAQPGALFGPVPVATLWPRRIAHAPGLRGLPLPLYLCPSDHV